MKLLIFGDVHIADKPPAGRVDDYTDAVLSKLEAISHICEVQGVEYALSLGDIYHTKQANRVSHRLVQQLIHTFKNFPCRVLVAPGNHDYGPAGLDSLAHQPLGTLAEAGAIDLALGIELLSEEGCLESQCWLIPRPYDAAADGLSGETDPSYYSLTEKEQERIETAPENVSRPRPVIGLAHGSLLAPGDSRPYPYVNVDKIPGIEQYDLLVSGHIHESLGVVKVGKTLFANPGSIGRTRRDIATYARTVEVLIVTVDESGVGVEEVPLPGVAPALEVFGNREAEDTPNLPTDEIAQFVSGLGEGLRADQLSLPELIAELGDIPPEVKIEVERLLEENTA